MRRAALLLLIALAAGACSTFGEPAAATVDGVEISTKDIEREIDAVTSNEEYRGFVEAQFGQVRGIASFSSAYAAELLSIRIYVALIDQWFEDEGIEVPSDVLDSERERVRQSLEGQSGNIFDTFPEDYQNELVHQQAVLTVLEERVRTELGDDPEAYYEANPDAFAEICVSHVLVGLQGGRTPEEAEQRAAELRARIESGDATFEEVATKESDDTVAAQQAGALGCGSRQALQFDPAFEAAAFDLDEGELSQPVLTQFGAHLILVTDRRIPDFADVGDEALTTLEQGVNTRFRDILLDLFCDGDVDVSSRYGSWDTSSCRDANATFPRVQPPAGPTTTSTTDTTFSL